MTIEELIDQYGDGVLRLCLMYLGDRQLAEDAFQETFVKAWRHLADFRGDSSVRTWLSRIAINTCRSMLRSGWFRIMRKAQSVDALLELAAPEDERDLDLLRAVCTLPGKYREVVALYYYENMKIREIAAALHLSENTVSTRLRAARRLLHTELQEEVEA